MKKRILKITPVDWVGFRQSKSFSSSESSIFPSPKTFYGAIFTEYGRQNGEDWESVYNKYISEALKLSGPFLIKNSTPYFPVPAILKKQGNKLTRGFIDHSFEFEMENTYENTPEIVKLKGIRYESMRDIKAPDESLISLTELEKFKFGESEVNLTKSNEIYSLESKVGLALEKNSRTSKKGAFYSFSYYRFHENCGFAFFIEDDKENVLKDIKVVQLGTKGKLAKVEVMEIETKIFDEVESEIYGAMLISPAVFLGGVLPVTTQQKPIAIANYKPVTYGFWDRKKDKAAQLFKAVPPGSVYYFEKNYKPKELTDKFGEFGFGNYIQIKERR
jgi:CRISPR-associated protein Cmr3